MQKKCPKTLVGFRSIKRVLINWMRSGRPRYVSLLNAFNKQELGKADLTVLPDTNFGEEIVNILIGENIN